MATNTVRTWARRFLATSLLGISAASLMAAYRNGATMQAQTAQAQYVVHADSQYYTVKPGDALERIVKAVEGTTPTRSRVQDIVQQNSGRYPSLTADVVGYRHGRVERFADGEQGDVLYPGQRLLLSVHTDSALVQQTHTTRNVSPLPAALIGAAALGAAALLTKPQKHKTPLDEAIDNYLGRYDKQQNKYDFTVPAVCAQTGISKRNLYAALREQGYDTRAHYRQLAAHYRRAYARESDAPAAALAAELGVSVGTIYKYRSTVCAP